MIVTRDCTKNGKSKPRLSEEKRVRLVHLMTELRALIGRPLDTTAHTVQIVFTSDKHESAVTIQKKG